MELFIPSGFLVDLKKIVLKEFTFFGVGCKTVTGTCRGPGIDGSCAVSFEEGKGGTLVSLLDGSSRRCCMEWFCLVLFDAILKIDLKNRIL